MQSVSSAECQAMCDADAACRGYDTYYGTICNLSYMDSCTIESTSANGKMFRKEISSGMKNTGYLIRMCAFAICEPVPHI